MSKTKQLVIDMNPQEFRIDIKKIGDQWVVGNPRSTSPVKKTKLSEVAGLGHLEWPNKFRGDRVTWILDEHGPAASAHFQFPEKLFTNVKVEAAKPLTRDMVAEIPARGGEMTLLLHKDANRRTQPHYYAVWIQEESGTGQYAVGANRNPPPEINVGP